MADTDDYNFWYAQGCKWASEGQDLPSGLTALAFSGGGKHYIFAFTKGFNAAKPPPTPPQPEKEDV